MAMRDLTHLRRPIVVAAFSGWNDAGDAATGVLDHLTQIASSQFAFSLDPDDYYDFSENRPVLVRADPKGDRTLQWATTELHVVSLAERDLVLINGPEPNFRWRAFSAALVSALRSVAPERIIAMGAMLADVPHSRPVPVSENGTDYEGPTGIVGVFASACADAGLPTTSLWASVPHYVADPPNPKATLALLRRVEDLIDVTLDHAELPDLAEVWETRVGELVTEDPDVATYVGELEERFDTAETTGDDIALQAERYLRRRER
ncbi:MAG: PAC2 family protein [Propioniciclava sp.]